MVDNGLVAHLGGPELFGQMVWAEATRLIAPLAQTLKQSRRIGRWLVPILIFLLAFFPCAIYPVSRGMRWYDRAVPFSDALLAQDWAGTYHSYHPGVTVMWLAGIGMKLFAWQRGLSSDQLLGAYPSQPGSVDGAIVAGVFPLALVVALCYPVLKRLVGQKVALAGTCRWL